MQIFGSQPLKSFHGMQNTPDGYGSWVVDMPPPVLPPPVLPPTAQFFQICVTFFDDKVSIGRDILDFLLFS